MKKYHPDKFAGTDLEEVAKEKLQEVNEAYSMLMGNSSSQRRSYSNYNAHTSSQYDNDQIKFQQIRQLINAGNLYQAEILLASISTRDAEWYYLNGLILWQKGWYLEARSSVQRAVNMNPGNPEYRDTLIRFNNAFNTYQYRPMGRVNSGMDFCDCCATLYCADCFCECCGGDLIPCC